MLRRWPTCWWLPICAALIDLGGRASRAQPVSGVHQHVGGVDHLLSPGQLAQCVHHIAGQVERVERVRLLTLGEILPADAADAGALADALPGQDFLQQAAADARLVEQRKGWEALGAQPPGHIKRADVEISGALVADDQQRVARPAQDEQRLLKARVKAGQIGHVGKVLAVAIDDQVG